VLSPTGTHPDGFNTRNGQFCAWHDDTADPNLPAGPVSSALDVAFTNMPYVTDLGAAHSGWRQVSKSVIAGHSYTLKLISHDDNDVSQGDGNYTRVDDVVSR
jgi:hypothetical protein